MYFKNVDAEFLNVIFNFKGPQLSVFILIGVGIILTIIIDRIYVSKQHDKSIIVSPYIVFSALFLVLGMVAAIITFSNYLDNVKMAENYVGHITNANEVIIEYKDGDIISRTTVEITGKKGSDKPVYDCLSGELYIPYEQEVD